MAIPKGNFVSGSILLKDNVNLKLLQGSVLLGSTDIADYQMLDPFLTGISAPLGYCFVGAHHTGLRNMGQAYRRIDPE
jgi:polygalacturonase